MSEDVARVKSERSTTSPKGSRSGRREERRAVLVRAATAAIRKHGPDVAMEDIATEAGVSKPILYRYFQDKADLHLAVSEDATGLVRAALLRGLNEQTDPRTLLRLVIDTYLTFIQQEPNLYRFVAHRSFPERTLQREPVRSDNEPIAGTLAQIFRDWLVKLGTDPGGADTWAHAGVGMVQAAGDWWLASRTLPRETLRDYLLTMVWGALDGILQASQLSTEKPTRRPVPGPIST